MTDLELTSERDGERATLVVTGEVDLASAPSLETDAKTLLADGVRQLVLDLRGVAFMDSTGLRAVLSVRDAAHEAGGSLTLARPSDAVRRLLDVAGLTGRLDIEP